MYVYKSKGTNPITGPKKSPVLILDESLTFPNTRNMDKINIENIRNMKKNNTFV